MNLVCGERESVCVCFLCLDLTVFASPFLTFFQILKFFFFPISYREIISPSNIMMFLRNLTKLRLFVFSVCNSYEIITQLLVESPTNTKLPFIVVSHGELNLNIV